MKYTRAVITTCDDNFINGIKARHIALRQIDRFVYETIYEKDSSILPFCGREAVCDCITEIAQAFDANATIIVHETEESGNVSDYGEMFFVVDGQILEHFAFPIGGTPGER